MQDQSVGRTLIVIVTAMVAASGVAAAVTGVRPGLTGKGVTLASSTLPVWNILEICASDSAMGQCRILEAEAQRTLSGGWDEVPESFRNACLGAIKSPYDKSYRLLSQCLEAQALKGLDKDVIATGATADQMKAAQAPTPAPAPSTAAPSPAPSAPPAAPAAAAGFALLPTTTTADLFKAREAWGRGGAAKTVDAPLAAGAVSPLPKSDYAVPQGFSGPPTVHPLEATPPATLSAIPQDQISAAMKALLAERAGWLSAPAAAAAPAAAPAAAAAPASESNGYATLPTTSPADLFKAREAWGAGPPAKTVDSPLAVGAYSPLPQPDFTLPKGFDGTVTVHPLEASPVAQPTTIPQQQISDALKQLLAERAGWLSAPATAAPAPSPASEPDASGGYTLLPTTSTADLVKAREAWGSGPPAKAVAAPLAAGAKSALRKSDIAQPKGFAGQPNVHAPAATPPPSLSAIPQDQIAAAMKKLLAEREAWGTAPAQRKTAAAATPKSAEAADCEAKLKQRATSGVILFKSSSAAIDAKSDATLAALADIAKACAKGRIRVEGHTDSSGRADFNKRLSESRAKAVADRLIAVGVKKDRVEAVGMGSEKPVASNDDAEGRAKNRRIEFIVVD